MRARSNFVLGANAELVRARRQKVRHRESAQLRSDAGHCHPVGGRRTWNPRTGRAGGDDTKKQRQDWVYNSFVNHHWRSQQSRSNHDAMPICWSRDQHLTENIKHSNIKVMIPFLTKVRINFSAFGHDLFLRSNEVKCSLIRSFKNNLNRKRSLYLQTKELRHCSLPMTRHRVATKDAVTSLQHLKPRVPLLERSFATY